MRRLHLLHKNDLPGEIEIHTDILSIAPSALSRKRALKVGRERQVPMEDKGHGCFICNPEIKEPGSSTVEVVVPDRVACFTNDYPYLPGDQKVVFLWHSDEQVRKRALHRFRLEDFERTELYWMLNGCVLCGRAYELPVRTYDLMRMVAGLNIGKLAGQSLPHFHMQYGWEVALEHRSISQEELNLYFEELAYCDLVIFENERVRLVAPWTPKGQFALELYFRDKYDLLEMDDLDMRMFACIGSRIIQEYRVLGIENLNIVFGNSPKGRKIEPLVAHFVPRVNMTALYEIRGVNVVDTPPPKIAEEFRRGINWVETIRGVGNFDPDAEFKRRLEYPVNEMVNPNGGPSLEVASPSFLSKSKKQVVPGSSTRQIDGVGR
jgi:diadenosine tetraphosphate (Ap4A) HIT family hydrolase